MNIYPLLIFVHVLAAVSMFAAWSVEAVVIAQLRQTSALDHARQLARVRSRWRMMGPVAMLTALGTGIWMMLLRWMAPGAGPLPWMAGSIAALIMIAIVGIALERRAAPRFREAIGGETAATAETLRRASDVLAISLTLRTALGIGILALMTTKPAATETAVILAAAILGGLGTTLVLHRPRAAAGVLDQVRGGSGVS
jgi:hypothetical protein